MTTKRLCLGTCALILAASLGVAGEWPSELKAFHGTTPKIDGVLSTDEWKDATTFEGVKGWTPQFSPTTDPADLSLKGWVKYDDHRLYFAFEVTDDVLYGIATDRWLSEKNPKAHDLTREGWPWFGDEMELLINATNSWKGDENAAGNGFSWQIVCNLTKSRLGGIGTSGLLEGEPRVDPAAWETYQRWIKTGAMEAVSKVTPDKTGYIIEWAVSFDPCLELKPGVFFKPTDKEVRMGLNIAVGDLDEKAKGEGNFGNFHHEDWFAGEKNKRTNLRQWGTLVIMPGNARKAHCGSSDLFLMDLIRCLSCPNQDRDSQPQGQQSPPPAKADRPRTQIIAGRQRSLQERNSATCLWQRRRNPNYSLGKRRYRFLSYLRLAQPSPDNSKRIQQRFS